MKKWSVLILLFSMMLFAQSKAVIEIESVVYTGFSINPSKNTRLNIIARITDLQANDGQWELKIEKVKPNAWGNQYDDWTEINPVSLGNDFYLIEQISGDPIYLSTTTSEPLMDELTINLRENDEYFPDIDSYSMLVVIDKPFTSLSQSEQLQIAEKYMPVLRMDDGSDNDNIEKEYFVPKEVDIMLDFSDIYIDKTYPIPNEFYNSDASKESIAMHCSMDYILKFCIDDDDQNAIRDWYLENEEDYNTQLYASFFEGTDGEIAVTYYLYYLHNRNVGLLTSDNHLGEWEGMTIILNSNLDPVEASTSNHKAAFCGKRRYWNRIEKIGNHPVVYVANGGHASFFHPGISDNQGGIKADYHNGNGQWVLPQDLTTTDVNNYCSAYGYKYPSTINGYSEGNQIEILPRVDEIDIYNLRNYWYLFSGFWGQSEDGTKIEFDSPRGPLFVGSELNDGTVTDGSKWFDPFNWTYDQAIDMLNFTIVPNSGTAPLNVSFLNSTTLDLYGWDFNSDNIIDSYNKNDLYTYTNVGQNTITVIGSDENFLGYGYEKDYYERLPNYINVFSFDLIISGNISTSTGTPITGVNLTGTNGITSTTTDSNGDYTILVPVLNWSGTIIPSKTGYSFDPVQKSYSNVTSSQINQDYAGTFNSSSVAPSITITEPNNIQENNYCFIVYDADDSDSNAEIYFYYDNNNYGNNGTCINPTSPVYEDNPSTVYAWNVQNVPVGTYWIYAKISDGTNTVYQYSPGYVEVIEIEERNWLRIDDQFYETSDEDQWAERGESIDYEIVFENREDFDIYQVEIQMICETSGIIMTDDDAERSVIESGDTFSPTFDFDIPTYFNDVEGEFFLDIKYEDFGGIIYSQRLYPRDIPIYPSTLIPPYFSIATDLNFQTCAINQSITYKIKTQPVDKDYSHIITLNGSSTSGGLIFDFVEDQILPGDSTYVNISNNGSLTSGIYDFNITGTTTETQISVPFQIEFVDATSIQGGDISGVFTLSGSPYFVEGDIIIPEGETLEIEAGVEVQMRGSFSISVYGTLISMGTIADSVKFSCNDTTIGWKGIKFYDTSDQSRLNFSEISYAKSTSHGAGIFMNNSDAIIADCYIHNNYLMANDLYGAGVYVSGGKPVYLNTTIANNSSSFEVYALGMASISPEIKILGCKIINNQNTNDLQQEVGGLYIRGTDTFIDVKPLVANTLIAGNRVYEDAAGVEILGSVDFVNCVIANNAIQDDSATDNGGGIKKRSDGAPHIYNSIIYGNTIGLGGIGYEVWVDPEEDPIYFEYCSIKNLYDNTYVNGPVIFVEGNGSINPLFTQNYELGSGSECIDGGNPNMIDNILPPGQGTGIADMGIFGGEANDIFDGKYLITPIVGDFNTINLGREKVRKFKVHNFSDENVICDIANVPNSDITISKYSFVVLPYSEEEITITWAPSSLGSMKEVIDISMNDKVLKKTIFGECASTGVLENDIYGFLPNSLSPYTVEGDIYIPVGETLTIEEGVVINFNGNYKIEVYGNIISNGTSENNITITRPGSDLWWFGIRFYNSLNNKFDYTNISNTNKVLTYDFEDDDRRGGVLYSISSELELNNCHIFNNKSAEFGGALFSDSQSKIKINHCIIENNRIDNLDYDTFGIDTYGGGLCFINSDVDIYKSIFSGNYIKGDYTSDDGNRPYLEGGAIFADESNVNIIKSEFNNNKIHTSFNRAEVAGGAICTDYCKVEIDSCCFINNYVYATNSFLYYKSANGGAVCDGVGSTINIYNSYFEGNFAKVTDSDTGSSANGGAVYEGNIFVNNIFKNNYVDAAEEAGGGACDDGSTFIRNVFINNYTGNVTGESEGGAVNYGGNFYNNIFIGNHTGAGTIKSEGGAVKYAGEVINNVFYNNYTTGATGYGGAMLLRSANVYNNIFYSNSSSNGSEIAGYVKDGSTYLINLNYNLIDNLSTTALSITDHMVIGTNNLDTDPLFVNSSINDLHLQSSSPCIDIGHPSYPDAVLADTLGLKTQIADLGAYGGPNNADNRPTHIVPYNESNISDTSPHFDWSDVPLATSYDLVIDDAQDFSSPLIYSSISSSEFDMPVDLSLTTYYWKVRSISDNITGLYSSEWVFNIGLTPIPPKLSQPSNESYLTDTTPTLNWTQVSSGIEYELMVDNNSDFTSPICHDTITTNVYSFSEDLLHGTYYWKVYALNEYGSSSSTPTWNFNIGVIPISPKLYKPENEDFLINAKPDFYWSDVSNAIEYRIIVDNDSDFSSPTISEKVIESFFTPNGDLGYNSYYWKVSAINEFGEGSFSNPRTFTVEEPLFVPENISIIIAENILSITWDVVHGATHYKVYSSNDPYGEFSLTSVVTTNAYSVDAGVTKLFYYIVASSEPYVKSTSENVNNSVKSR